MASLVNGSFASPLANADYPAISDNGLVSRIYSNTNGLSVFVTFLLALVAYDQCKSHSSAIASDSAIANHPYSHVHMAEGINCRACLEDAIRRTFPVVSPSENGRVQGKVCEWGIELCLGIPQV